MIKPSPLWALCKECPDSKWIGDILRRLGGQDVTLDFGQQRAFEMIRRESEWMDENADKQREKWKERQQRSRFNRKNSDVTDCHGDNGDKCDKRLSRLPSVHRPPSSDHPSTVHPPELLLPDTVTVHPAASTERSKPKPESVDWSKVKCSADEDFFDPLQDPALQAAKLIGDTEVRFRRYARGWIGRNGDDAFRTELFEFHREIAAGEEPDDRAKAFTARLAKKDKPKK